MPSEVDLARDFGVSVMTVRQAYNQLVSAGAVVRRRFKGTWAATHLTDDLEKLSPESYPERWKRQVQDVKSEVLCFDLRPAPQHVASRFGVKPQTSLAYLERKRLADGIPIAWDTRWMPARVFEVASEEDFKRASVFAALGKRGFVSSTMQSEISARLADMVHAETLSCDRREVLLVRQLVCRSSEGTTTIVGTSLYPSTRFSFSSTTILPSWRDESEEDRFGE